MTISGVEQYSTTAASNTDVAGVNIAEGCPAANINNAIRRVMADVKRSVGTKGSDIASASSIDLGAATGQFVDITGTTTITALGTVAAGTWRVARFTGTLTLTHNATSLIFPGAADITTAAGDVAAFLSLGSGNWVCATYERANGLSVSAILAAINALSSTGLIARTGAGAVAARTITGTSGEVAVSNGDGVSGNPTLSLPTALTFTGKTVTGGTFSGITLSGTTTLPGSGSISSSGAITSGTGQNIAALGHIVATQGNSGAVYIFGGGDNNSYFQNASSGNIVFRAADGGIVSFTIGCAASANRHPILTPSNGGNPTLTASAGEIAVGGNAWTFGTANVVSPTSPNRTLTVTIGGTTYYIAAKTTND
ncbi:hypothetical protein [Ferrovibrio sp.]|uniref:hypothetical protein n=1 Tax=Ferrovibrio sp. TaxID=1917215 RepID=UPI0035B47213